MSTSGELRPEARDRWEEQRLEVDWRLTSSSGSVLTEIFF